MTAIATGYVYLLKSGPYVKIGMTNNVGKRTATLSAQPPFFTDLLAYFWLLDAHKTEAQLHRQYAGYRVHGEWFQLSWDQIDAVVTELKHLCVGECY